MQQFQSNHPTRTQHILVRSNHYPERESVECGSGRIGAAWVILFAVPGVPGRCHGDTRTKGATTQGIVGNRRALSTSKLIAPAKVLTVG